ncbi:fatty-acid amide hydrolase 2-A isoform X3 [Rhipicephalus sanguineus]|uniref:fatty-acid amide hydrolase 2-A isoform X3 n=1 Tax=Rhipicephalus sanguineus TaxID=34632 RepID=UPI001894E190|nr:fatty-acid amide hydrolase 2-A isoform X3 [Rhipicephalus sanguineus]
MATILGSCRELLVELAVYLWCTVTRLVFALWFCWKKPRPLPPVTDELLLRSATSLAADIRNDKVKSVDLVSAYIRRIREVQPIINAVVEERFEEALKDAEEVDRLVTSGTMSASQMSKEKPLLGLPFTSKNSIAIKGMRQDAGSLFWHGRRAEEDAPSVALLRAAGAIPLALTNVPEMCMWGDSQNLVDGCTRNPHDTRRNPGGSSGGEGSLLAASGSLIGLGTDIGGSIRIPAAFCGIFGHKPTAGVVPNTGLLPDVGENLEQFNCVGPMTRFAEDLPLVFNVLAGSTTMRLRLNEKVNLNMLKLYYMDTEGSLYISRTTNDARRAVRQVVRYLNETHGLQGHPLQLPELRFGTFEWFKVAGVKEPKPLSEVFRPGGFNTVVELLRHLVGAGRHTLAALVACIMKQLCRFRSKPKGEAYATSLENVRDRFEETLGDNGVLVLPAATSAALFQNQDLMFFDSAGMTSLFSLFKVPSTVCPVLRSADNLPLCVQVVAKRGNDRLCLAVAREIEKRFGGWIDPSAKVQGRA